MTRRLLAAGACAGPLFYAAVLTQLAVRDGFDPRRHPLSLLALGPGGWLQVAVFVVTGLLVAAGATGAAAALREPGRGHRAAPVLLGVSGVMLVVAGVFRTDPYHGYPAGADESPTWHGVVHSAAPALSGLAGVVCYVLLARRFARLGRRTWALATIATLVLVLGLSIAGSAVGDFRVVMLGDAAGYVWLTAFFLDLRRRSTSMPGPGGRPPLRAPRATPMAR